jgi:hypothetical protein
MKIFIKIKNQTIKIECEDNLNIYYLKKKIENKCNICRSNFWLSVSGKILLDEYILNDIINDENNLINLYFHNLDIILITSNNKNFYVELNMVLMSRDIKYKFDKIKDIVVFKIKNEYFDEKIFMLWNKFYNIYRENKNDLDGIIIKKPLNYNKLISLLNNNYIDFFNLIDYNDLIKLNNLMGYLNIEIFFNIISAYIAGKYIINIDKKNIDIIVIK